MGKARSEPISTHRTLESRERPSASLQLGLLYALTWCWEMPQLGSTEMSLAVTTPVPCQLPAPSSSPSLHSWGRGQPVMETFGTMDVSLCLASRGCTSPAWL